MLFQDFFSSCEHKLRYFWLNPRAFSPCIDSNATDTVKAQKGCKIIIQIVCDTSGSTEMLSSYFCAQRKQK